MANLKLALSVPNIPQITQTLLNLAEFLEHCEEASVSGALSEWALTEWALTEWALVESALIGSPASWTLLTFYFISARKAKMGRRVQQQSLALRNI